MSELSILFARPRGLSGDDRFELEALAAEELGIESWAIPLDPVVGGDAERALRHLPPPSERTWLYRGWMLDTEEYEALFEAIEARDETMVVHPEEMAAASLAPLWIPALANHTAPSRWTDDEDVRAAWELALELGPPPWIVKDHVKSAKEEWHRACFVPEAASFDDFRAVCERLVEVRGDRFTGGFVVRKYLELATLPGFTSDRRREVRPTQVRPRGRSDRRGGDREIPGDPTDVDAKFAKGRGGRARPAGATSRTAQVRPTQVRPTMARVRDRTRGLAGPPPKCGRATVVEHESL